MSDTSFSREELLSYAENHVAFYGLDLSRISSVLIIQIYHLEKRRELNIFEILDEVKYMEGLIYKTVTGKDSKFNGAILRGLSKKHFMNARFIKKNIGLHLGYETGRTNNLDKIIKEAFQRNTSGYVDEKFVNFIGYKTTIGAFEERAKKSLTGEWIIFKKFQGNNYYLTLAAHDEGDENILARVHTAYDFDFSFLNDVSQSN